MGNTRLTIRDLRIEMPIGIYAEDKTKPCPLLINLEADVVLPDAWQSDDYSKVLGYDKLRKLILEITAQGHLNLLETLAETVATRCFEWPQVQTVKIRIEKTDIFPDCIPGVEILRSRDG